MQSAYQQKFLLASFYISLIVAYFSPLIGVYYYNWNIIEIVFFYILEAALLFFYHLFAYFINGLPGKNPAAKKDFFNIGIFLVQLWEMTVIILAFTIFKREFQHSFLGDENIYWRMVKILWVPLLFLILNYVINFIYLYQKKEHITVNRPLSQWFWQICLPLLICMFLINHYGNSLYFIKDEIKTLYKLIEPSSPPFWLMFWLFIISCSKIAAELIDRQKAKKDRYVDDPNYIVVKPHPFSVYSIITNSLLVMYLCTAFMALSPETMDQKWGISGAIFFLLGLAVIIIAVLAYDFKFPYKTYVILNKADKKIIIRRKFLSSEKLQVVELSQIKKIYLKYSIEGSERLPFAYCFRTTNLKPLVIKKNLFSKIELYNFIKYLKDNYTGFDVTLDKEPPKSHFGL